MRWHGEKTEMHKRILVVVDDRLVTQTAIRQAIELAHAIRADIHFYCIIPNPGVLGLDILTTTEFPHTDWHNEATAHAQKLLATAVDRAEQAGIQSFCTLESGIDGAQCVSNIAKRKRCHFIVVGAETEKSFFMQFLSGCIVSGLISVASSPVLVCRDTDSNLESGFAERTRDWVGERQRRAERAERRWKEKND